jgi:hypothetical protein
VGLFGQNTMVGESLAQALDDERLGSRIGLGDGINRAFEPNLGERGLWKRLAHDSAGFVRDTNDDLQSIPVVYVKSDRSPPGPQRDRHAPRRSLQIRYDKALKILLGILHQLVPEPDKGSVESLLDFCPVGDHWEGAPAF